MKNIEQLRKDGGSSKKGEEKEFFKMEDEFSPYAFHLNSETVVTKSFQLLQTIKLGGFSNDELHSDEGATNIRDEIRAAVLESIKTDNFAIWIHTVRKRVDLSKILSSDVEIVQSINKDWNYENRFDNKYINEVYITILTKGVEISGKAVALRYFTENKLRKHLELEFEKALQGLNQVVNGMLKTLAKHTPKKLSIVKRGEKYYSEQVEFFHRILNLVEIEFEVDEVDISEAINISEIALSLNKFDLKNEFKTCSVSILTLKYYLETDPRILDKILSLPFEFIIYQAFNFINIAEVEWKYKHQFKMLQASNDTKLLDIFGLSGEEFKGDISKSDAKIRYGESQIGIVVISDAGGKADVEVKQMVETVQKVGFVAIRDDVMIEDAFFASLPGNFAFLRRMQPIQTSKIAGFTSIDNHSTGKIKNNTWGDSICLFRSQENLPYFFNFHDDSDYGHTIFFGKEFDIQKNAIANFLELQSLKYNTRIINIDFAQNTKLFSVLCSGNYEVVSLKEGENTICLNPCKLFKDLKTREIGFQIFENFLQILLEINGKLKETSVKYLKEKIMPFVKANFGAFGTLEELSKLIKNEKVIKTFFSPILEGGAFYHIFKSGKDAILDGNFQILSINALAIHSSTLPLKLLFEYLLQTLLLITNDNKKTIIKIDNFLRIARQINISSERIFNILTSLKKKNTILMMLESYHDFIEYQTTPEEHKLFECISTQIYTPPFVSYGIREPELASNFLKNLETFAGLGKYEKDAINNVSFEETLFTVKHAGKVVVLTFDPNFSHFWYFYLASRSIDDNFLIHIKSAESFEERLAEAKSVFEQLFQK